MKYFLSISFLALSLSSQMAFACLGQNQNQSIENHQIQQYLEQVSYLSSGYKRNEMIEKCYFKNKSKLSFSQVKIFLSGLEDYNTTHQYDNEETQDRISADYFSMRINSIEPELAVSIAKKQNSGFERNKRIEEYFNTHKADLGWSEIQTLLNGLGEYNSTNRYDNEETQDRIISSYFETEMESMNPEAALNVIKKLDSGTTRNKKIEEYFNSQKNNLSWEEVQFLLGGLFDFNSNSYYDNEETQDRIILAWHDRE